MSDATFMLFIAGANNPKSINAIKNLKREFRNKDYNLMVIDILTNPRVAESVGIVATPLLMRTNPDPVERYIGDFSKPGLNLCI
ncbi:MAG: Circadian clock protein KaiB [Promethearchaeota archaeon]|nr:MAG: Circadian clock protein KaiB [Candidatus Lokiarchaeota archaeon]